MTSRIAVIGPGAIGGTLAAWLGDAPSNDVTLCARTAFVELVVEAPGRTLASRPRVSTSPSNIAKHDNGAFDWVITTTKAYDTEGAAAWLRVASLVGPDTCVAVVQNGVEHMDRFAGIVPRERTLPVIVDIPAERSAPGRIVQRRHGDITAPACDLGARFAKLFAGTDLAPTLHLSADFLSASWRKLALNSATVVNALALRPAGLVHHQKAADLMRAIARESVAVGRAVGAKLEDALAEEVITRSLASDPRAKSSLLADRLAGRPLEIDARNGVIVRLGAKHGVPTPLNAMAVTLLEAWSEARE